LNLSGKAKFIGDVGFRVSIVVDVERIEDVVTELEEVRPARRFLQRNLVGEDRYGVGLVGTHERIDISVVCHRIF
jgi:hypothetical protein